MPTSTQIPGANGTPYTVQGPILAKYQSLTDAQQKDLGAPYDNEQKTKDGSGIYQQFDGGVLIYKTGGPVYFVWGKIRDAWNAHRRLRRASWVIRPADEQSHPDGSYKSTFEHGIRRITLRSSGLSATVDGLTSAPLPRPGVLDCPAFAQ